MVTRWLHSLILIFIVCNANAQDTVSINLSGKQTTVELGKPVSTSAIDPKTGQPLQIRLDTSFSNGDTLWARQQLTLMYTIQTSSQYSQFRFTSVTPGKYELRPFVLAAKQISQQQFVHRLGWSLQVHQAGRVHIELPALQYIVDGVTTHTFYTAPLVLKITPLPLYVPATMPVGRVDLLEPRSWLFATTDSLSELQLTMTGDGVPANQLPIIDSNVHSQKGVRTYPAKLISQENFAPDGIHSEIAYRVPFKATTQGFRQMADITVAWFDPTTGTINSKTISPPLLISAQPWLVLLLAAVTLFILYKLLQHPARTLWLRMQRYRIYKSALQQLLTLNSAAQLRDCIRKFALARGLGENIAPGQWLASYELAAAHERTRISATLNAFFYDKQPVTDINTVRQQLVLFCNKYQ